MNELIVVSFPGEETAEQALRKLLTVEPDLVVDLQDAVVTVRDRHGKVRLEQTVDLVTARTSRGMAWGGLLGTLVGVLLLNPLVGLLAGVVLGAGAGALSGALADYGVDDHFIKAMARGFEPGTSALFILVRRIDVDRLMGELAPLGGSVVTASLSGEQEERLKTALQGLGGKGAGHA